MAEASLTLFVDLDQGSRIGLEQAAYASLAWSVFIRTIGGHVDPMNEWRVELDSALPGSQRIRSIIKLPDTAEGRALIQGAVIASLIFIAKETVAWGVGEVMDYIAGPDAPAEAQRLSESERQEIAKTVVALLHSGLGREEAGAVYDALKADQNVRGAGSTANPEARPRIVIQREDFPALGEEALEELAETRTIREETELTLIRPILTNDTSRRWGFLSRFGSFGAPIRDEGFLSALAAGELNVPLSQGIRMRVEIDVTERRDGEVWVPVDRVITRVIEIIPPPKQARFDLEGPQ